MYNNNYINTFDISYYKYYLNNQEELDKLKKAYINKYNLNKTIEVRDILFKESLDHYILKQITDDYSFLYSKEMTNYIKYIISIYNYNSLELTTNIVFRNKKIKDNILNIYLSKYKDNIERKRLENSELYDKIINKINNKENITQNELDYVAEFIANIKNLNLEGYKIFLKYVFGDMKNTNLVFSIQVQDAVLAYLPFYYKDGVTNVRYVLGDTDFSFDIKGPAHSTGISNYIAVNRNIFKNIDYKSIENSNVERLKIGNDITFFMIVAFHELTHQVQKLNCKSSIYDDMGMGYIIKLILNKKNSDYKINHDSDEIEIKANEVGWKKCVSFYNDFYSGKDKDRLVRNCIVNNNTSKARRAFSYKLDNNKNKVPYSDYDIKNLVSIINSDKSIIEKYPMLKNFFNPDTGVIRLSCMYNFNIYTKSTGKEFINYFYNNNGINAMINHLNNKKLSNEQVIYLINNLTYFILDNLNKKIDDILYVLNHKSSGEYRNSEDFSLENSLNLIKRYYIQSCKHYELVKPLLDKIYFMYPDKKVQDLINHQKQWIEEGIIKKANIINIDINEFRKQENIKNTYF